MVNVLFVCLGNICRSPMAEGVFQQLVYEAGLSDKIHVDSAGTSSYHIGETAHSGTLRTLKKHNIDYKGLARQLTQEDFHRFNYILAMDTSNLRSIRSIMPADNTAHIALLLDYAQHTSIRDVPDPYYTGEFDKVYDLVDNACRHLLAMIRQTHSF